MVIPVVQALNLALLLMQQINIAVQSRQETIEIENLGDEHREALEQLEAHLGNQGTSA